MRKYSHESIQSIVKLACKEFLEDDSSLGAYNSVSFTYKGHTVEAYFEWSKSKGAWYLACFSIVYSRAVMRYFVDTDYDLCFAWCF